MKYFKKKNRIYTSILLSMSILFSSHAFASDLVPNEEVNGSNGRIVTGLCYLIGANTKRSGMLYMEANPADTRIRPTRYNESASDAQDWHWFLSNARGGGYLIGANTKRSGMLYMEANPANTRIRPTRYNESASDAQDWHWFFTPTNYRLSAVIQNFYYGGADLNALLNQAGEDFRQIVIERETIENTQNQGKILIQRTSSKETTYHCSWSFNSSDTVRLSHNLSVQVDYTQPFGLLGISGSVRYGLGYETEKIFSAGTVYSENKSETDSEIKTFEVASRTKLTITRKRTRNTVDIPFSARCTFSALADRARKNGTIASMVPVDNQGIRALLRHEDLLSENQYLQEDNTIIIRGTLRTCYFLTETTFNEELLDVVMP